jgi:hypothetical protein
MVSDGVGSVPITSCPIQTEAGSPGGKIPSPQTYQNNADKLLPLLLERGAR